MVCENPFSGDDGIARRKNGMLKKYGVEHNMKTNTSLEKRKNTYISNYGVEHPLKYQPIIKKIRSNNEKNGIWISRSEIKSFDLYKRYVKHFKNQQNLTQLPNYKFRGHSKNTTLYSLDHKFSCQQGFINNIPPYIIGNIVNLEFIPNTENSRKRENCSITMEELIDLFYRNHVTSFSI